jgi:methyltransferase (TIGR00027 family)
MLGYFPNPIDFAVFWKNLFAHFGDPMRPTHRTTESDMKTFYKPLAPVPDDHDLELHKRNCCPKAATRRLRELVPLLQVVGCVVEEIGPERTVLSLPLIESAMNQNGTQQAAVFYLIADYTLGVGMFGVLPGCYVSGVHDRCEALPVQCWLKRGSVSHLAPGTGKMRAEVQIPPEEAEKLRRQLIEKGRGEYSGTVRIYQESTLIAEANHTVGVYADVPRAAGARTNIFQIQNMKISAVMIAGLREDRLSQRVAGDQGRAIASRMSVASPQLPSLVRARTLDLERHLETEGRNYGQVVVLGVGLDPKPVRFSNGAQPWFGLDLRDMLRERERRFTEAGAHAQNFVPVVGDMLSDGWDTSLLSAGFSPDAPTLFIAEGISMYFRRDALARLLKDIRGLANSPKSRLWLDHVTSYIFDLDIFEVRSFLSSMTRLGEPFITGFDNPAMVAPDAWSLAETTSAAAAISVSDAIHPEYRFSILKPS